MKDLSVSMIYCFLRKFCFELSSIFELHTLKIKSFSTNLLNSLIRGKKVVKNDMDRYKIVFTTFSVVEIFDARLNTIYIKPVRIYFQCFYKKYSE